MAVLASVAVPFVQIEAQRRKEHELRFALVELRDAIDRYKRAVDEGRIASSLGDSGYPKSLAALVEGVDDLRSPAKQKIYFLRRIPRDPFADDPTADPAATWGLRSYASPPDEPAEGDDVFDVFSRSPRVALDGTAVHAW
jgi:general secretion pathway protein G